MRPKLATIVAFCVIAFVATVYFGDLISGGKRVAGEVMLAIKTNSAVLAYFGNVSNIRWNRGPEHVDLDFNGNRSGYTLFFIQGSKTNEEIKVDWVKSGTNQVQITRVWRTFPDKDNMLLWSSSWPTNK